ncbi:1-aminocyclopropane-1-carboxylate deaminase/D-cysteine desulfhydrase [Flavitalea flava]
MDKLFDPALDALFDLSPVPVDTVEVPELTKRKIGLDVLRLDKIHPVVSGNKWFKLKGHLQLAANYKSVITFGGPWSNHIIATAYTAAKAGISATGIIRGEKPVHLSETLQAASAYGMHLQFVDRESYRHKHEPGFLQTHCDAYIIPEGGAGEPGIAGSGEILRLVERDRYTHVLCAIGTGTMFLGLLRASGPGQKVIGIPVLKGIAFKLPELEKLKNCEIITDYHFGGYARKTKELLDFMNHFYETSGIPSDFVYTGKLFYAVMDMLKKDLFPEGCRLLVIHSGGLQGNRSLPPGTLKF